MQTMTERETPSVDGLVIGILGGTGDQGRGWPADSRWPGTR
jgi:hypothetical protein